MPRASHLACAAAPSQHGRVRRALPEEASSRMGQAGGDVTAPAGLHCTRTTARRSHHSSARSARSQPLAQPSSSLRSWHTMHAACMPSWVHAVCAHMPAVTISLSISRRVRRLLLSVAQRRETPPPATSAPGPGPTPATSAPGPCTPCHICAGTGLIRATFAPGPGSPLPHLRRDRGPPLTALRWRWALPMPHLRCNWLRATGTRSRTGGYFGSSGGSSTCSRTFARCSARPPPAYLPTYLPAYLPACLPPLAAASSSPPRPRHTPAPGGCCRRHAPPALRSRGCSATNGWCRSRSCRRWSFLSPKCTETTK
jgi:hypothetical protein